VRVPVFLACAAVLSASLGSAQAEDIRTVPSDPGFGIGFSWFDPAQCQGEDKTKFHFTIGDRSFAVAPGKLRQGRPKHIDAPLPERSQATGVRVPANAGCADQPLQLVTVDVLVEVEGGEKILTLEEVAAPAGELSAPAEEIARISSKGQCRTTDKPQLVVCHGSRTAGGKEAGVTFVVLLEPSGKVKLLETGSPIFAQCSEGEGKPGCTISAYVSRAVTINDGADLASLTGPKLRARHDALIALADAMSAN
jgi:hypothetical protein